MGIDFDKLNARATRYLKTLIKGVKGIRFTEEKKDGFYLETRYGTFWFQCETDDIKED